MYCMSKVCSLRAKNTTQHTKERKNIFFFPRGEEYTEFTSLVDLLSSRKSYYNKKQT